MVIFYFDHTRKRTSFLVLCFGVFILPFLVFIYIAIATGVISYANSSEECFLASKIWLMTDCIVFAFLVPDFLFNMYTLHSKNLKDHVNAVANEIIKKNAILRQLTFQEGTGKKLDMEKDVIELREESI